MSVNYVGSYCSPLGGITLASDGERLTGLWFDGQKYFGSTLSLSYAQGEPLVLSRTRTWLDLYFCGISPDFTPPLALKGSDFRLAVWELLLEIPYGQTVTYGELASELARQRGAAVLSAQAVGGAVGHNPICLIVPCHRVVGSGGSLTGYAGGIQRKEQLLALERAVLKQPRTKG